MKLIGIALFALSIAFPNNCLALDTTTIFEHREWSVRHEYYNRSGQEACAARTANPRREVMDITVYDDGDHILYFFLKGAPWNGKFEDDMKLHVDYKRWTLRDANFSEDLIKFAFSDLDKLVDFLLDISDGSAIALKTPNERQDISSWSLSGSKAAILKLFDCFDRIKVNGGSSTYGAGEQYGDR